MQALDVKNFLEEQLPGVQVEVEGAGCSFQLNLIDDALAALSRSSASSRSTRTSIPGSPTAASMPSL